MKRLLFVTLPFMVLLIVAGCSLLGGVNLGQGQVATPTFSPAAGSYGTDQSVTISSTAGSTIHFTIDGTTPTAGSSVYSAPISIAGNGTTLTIKAFAIETGMTDSAVTTAAYTITYPAPKAYVVGTSQVGSGALIGSYWIDGVRTDIIDSTGNSSYVMGIAVSSRWHCGSDPWITSDERAGANLACSNHIGLRGGGR